MSGPIVCPRCGATGNENCSTVRGNDHRARILAEVAEVERTRHPYKAIDPRRGGERFTHAELDAHVTSLASVGGVYRDLAEIVERQNRPRCLVAGDGLGGVGDRASGL